MKALIVIFLFISCSLFGQLNTLHGIFASDDLGVGLKYDRHIAETHYGYYCTFRYGSYHADECGRIVHYKTSFGMAMYIDQHDDYNVRFSAGVVGHYYRILETGYDDDLGFALFPVTFEMGTGCTIKRFNAGFSYDILKKDTEIMFGWSF